MENKSFNITTKQIAIGFSSIVAFLGGETFIGTQIIESKIQEFARPEIVRIVNHKADSILSHKKVSFREQIAKNINQPKDSIAKIISGIIRNELDFIGFFADKSTGKLRFKHVDHEIYRPIIDQASGKYYIILDDGSSIWCY